MRIWFRIPNTIGGYLKAGKSFLKRVEEGF
jgi:hypothetical protein